MPWGKQVPECNKVFNVSMIKIDGFDEFMAELHEALGCSLQQEVVEPYSALSSKGIELSFLTAQEGYQHCLLYTSKCHGGSKSQNAISFDEFMAELHEALGCSLQQEVVEPYSALSSKLDRYNRAKFFNCSGRLSTLSLIHQ
jgi:hypothetical protein